MGWCVKILQARRENRYRISYIKNSIQKEFESHKKRSKVKIENGRMDKLMQKLITQIPLNLSPLIFLVRRIHNEYKVAPN